MDKQSTDTPQLVVAGRFLTGQEEERWRRARRDPLYGWLLVASAFLLVVFSIQAVAASMAVDWQLPSVVFPIIATCAWFLIVWSSRVRRRRQQQFESIWMNRWRDYKTLEAGCMISLYDDHAAYSTMRGSSVLPYNEVTYFCETEDGILFGNERFSVCFRSADHTQTEFSGLRRFLCERVRPSLFRAQAMACPERAEPLPTVRFANYDTVITHAEIVPPPAKTLAELLGFILPQMILYGLVPAFLLPITPWPLVNCAIFCTVFMVGGALLASFAVWLKNRRGQPPVKMAFTKEGIAEKQEGILTFTTWARCAISQSRSGITVRYANGIKRDIPWSAVENPDALQQQVFQTGSDKGD